MKEKWKKVPSVPEISASSLGRVVVAPSQSRMPHGGLRSYKPNPTYGYEEKSSTGRPGVGKRKILRVGRLKRTFKVARLVCEAFHGPPPFPKAVTIHLDEDPTNNRPENLKWGTQKENLNMPKFKAWREAYWSKPVKAPLRKSNKSGFQGVSWSKGTKRWIARITVNKNSIWLGSFREKDEAIRARLSAESKYGLKIDNQKAMEWRA